MDSGFSVCGVGVVTANVLPHPPKAAWRALLLTLSKELINAALTLRLQGASVAN